MRRNEPLLQTAAAVHAPRHEQNLAQVSQVASDARGFPTVPVVPTVPVLPCGKRRYGGEGSGQGDGRYLTQRRRARRDFLLCASAPLREIHFGFARHRASNSRRYFRFA
jgi:hypothetical protein